MVVPMVLPQRVVTTAVYKRRQRDRTARVARTVLCTRHPGVLAKYSFQLFCQFGWHDGKARARTHTHALRLGIAGSSSLCWAWRLASVAICRLLAGVRCFVALCAL